MLTARFRWPLILAILGISCWAWAQPQPRPIPQNHAATQVAYANWFNGYVLFNGKNQPTWPGTNNPRPWFFHAADGEYQGAVWQMWDFLSGQWVESMNYPMIAVRGGWTDQETSIEFLAVDPVGTYWGAPNSWNEWVQGDVWLPPIASVEFGRTFSNNVFVGFDYRGEPFPHNYFRFDDQAGFHWPPPSFQTTIVTPAAIFPVGLAMYDLAFTEDADPPSDFLAVGSSEFDPLQPLGPGQYVVSSNVFWTGNVLSPTPTWHSLDLSPNDLANVQLCVRDCTCHLQWCEDRV